MSQSKQLIDILHGKDILDVDPNQIHALVPFLQSNSRGLDSVKSSLRMMSESSNTYLAIAYNRDSIVTGMTTINYDPTPTGVYGVIDDVVKHPDAIGGTGRSLVNMVCNHAFRQVGVDFVMLTSNTARTYARKMYGELGFVVRDTDVFRLNSEDWQIDES